MVRHASPHVRVRATFDQLPTALELEGYLDAARDYAKTNKRGLPAGFQTGFVALAVALVPEASPEAVQWARNDRPSMRGAIRYSVLAVVPTAEVYEPEKAVFGRIYRPFLRRIVDDVIRKPLASG